MSALITVLWSQFGGYIIAGLAGLAGILGYRTKVRSDLKKELKVKDQANAIEIAEKASDARAASARGSVQSDDGFRRRD